MLTKLNDNPESTKAFAITTEWTYAELELLFNVTVCYGLTPGTGTIVYSDTANDRPLQERRTADIDQILKKIIRALNYIEPLI